MTEDQKGMSEKRERILKDLDTSEGGAAQIKKAREIEVPEEKVKTYALRVIKADLRRGYSVDMALRMARNTGIATEDEVRETARRTYQELLGQQPSNIVAAEYLYGIDSEEYRRAKELFNQEERKKEKIEKQKEKDRKWEILREKEDDNEGALTTVSLTQDATFSDLFEAIEEGVLDVETSRELFAEIFHHLDEETRAELQKLHLDEPELAKTTKVLDFLRQRGFSKKDIETFWPIRFRRKRKEK